MFSVLNSQKLNTEATENHREIGISLFVDYSSSPQSPPCSLWLFSVSSVLNSDFRRSRALQFSHQNPRKNQSRANKRPRAEAFVEHDILSDGRENGFAGENQRRVRRARMALRPNQERIGNRRREDGRDDDRENQFRREMKAKRL